MHAFMVLYWFQTQVVLSEHPVGRVDVFHGDFLLFRAGAFSGQGGWLGDQIIRAGGQWGTNLYLISKKERKCSQVLHIRIRNLFLSLPFSSAITRVTIILGLCLVSKNKNFLTILTIYKIFWVRVCHWLHFTKPITFQTSHPIR